MIRLAYQKGARAALAKFALGPPTQVDQFVADVEHGKDIPPTPAEPPMACIPGAQHPPALDGTIPLQMPSASPPTPPGLGSTIGSAPDMGGPPPGAMGV